MKVGNKQCPICKKNIGGSPTGDRVEAPQALTCNTNTGVTIDPQELKSKETRGVKKIIGRVKPPNPPGKSDPGNKVTSQNSFGFDR